MISAVAELAAWVLLVQPGEQRPVAGVVPRAPQG